MNRTLLLGSFRAHGLRQLLLACAVGLGLAACGSTMRLQPDRGGFDLQAHRGGRALAPENTLAAFTRAMELGVTTLELDVGLSADGVVVISHDTALNPQHTRDAQGRYLPAAGPALHRLSFDQIRDYDVGRIDPASSYARQFPRQQAVDGERIPSLASLFDRVRTRGDEKIRFNIETKTDPTRPELTADPQALVKALLEEIRRAGMGSRATVQSFDWRTLALVGQLAPELPRAYLSSARTLRDPRWTMGLRLADAGSAPRLVRAAATADTGHAPGRGQVSWSPAYEDLSEAQVREAHALGLRVLPWTVNQPADQQRLIGWKVDGLITDDPAALREVMRAQAVGLPVSGLPR